MTTTKMVMTGRSGRSRREGRWRAPHAPATQADKEETTRYSDSLPRNRVSCNYLLANANAAAMIPPPMASAVVGLVPVVVVAGGVTGGAVAVQTTSPFTTE